MKKIRKYISIMLLLSIIIKPIRVLAQETEIQKVQQDVLQDDLEVKNLDIEAQTADTQTTYETEDGFTYTLNENNEATIMGCTVEHSNLVIPGSVDGYVVKTIGRESFENDTTITKLTISENIESIEAWAFSWCLNLEELYLPSTIKRIKNYAFELGNFSEVEIPEGCECIAIGAFESKVMHEIKIPKSVTRIGYNETTLEDKQYEILLGSTGERIIGYEGSAAESYANTLGKIFINIEWIPLQQFVLPENIQLNVNERVKFPISFAPEDAYSEFTKIDGYNIVEVTEDGVATSSIHYEVVDGELYVTPDKEGVAKFTVYKNAVKNYMPDFLKSNVCTITVIDPSKINADSITLKDGNNNIINNTTLSYDTYESGYTYPITIETNPMDANEDISFTSTNEYLAKVSKVDEKYVLTLQRGYFEEPKTCTITATGMRSGVTASFNVSVFYGGAESISFDSLFENNKNGRLNRIVQNSEYDMSVKVVPEILVNDSIISITQNPQTAGEEVITYNQTTGKLKAAGVGSAILKAECRGKSVSYDFEVLPYENKATGVTIDTNEKLTKTDTGYSLALNIDDTYKLSATILPEDTTDILHWDTIINYGVISLDNQGNIVALKEGTANIKAYSCSYLEEYIANAQSEYVTITVTDPNKVVEPSEPEEIIATDVTLDQKSCTLNVGDTLQLKATVTPSNTTDILKYNTNNTSVATISDTGLLTIVGAGTVRIGVEIRGMQRWITIKGVMPSTPPTITLNTTSITLNKGDLYTLSGMVTGNSNITPLTWDTENRKIADVTGNGEIIAYGAGNTRIAGTIYCFDTNEYYRVYCSVTVIDNTAVTTPITVQGISLNTSALLLDYGTASTLTASLYPQGAQGIIGWVSSNEEVATVANGQVVVKGTGTCQITATSNGISATCIVTVNPGSIKLNATKFNLQKGKTTKALTIKKASYENDKIVNVQSSNKKVLRAKLQGNNIVIKGLKTSKKYVKVTVKTESGATATCKVKVVKNKVKTSKLKLNKKNITLKKKEKITLVVTQTPITATDKLKWSSSNKKVATVNKKGKVVAKKKGTAIITLTSSNGKKVTCKIKVK